MKGLCLKEIAIGGSGGGNGTIKGKKWRGNRGTQQYVSL